MGALVLEEPTKSSRPHSSGGGPASTAVRFSRRSLAVLADAGAQLGGAVHVATVVERISAFIVPELADWYVLVVPQRAPAAPIVGYAHVDPERQAVLASVVECVHRPGWAFGTALGEAARGRMTWFPDLASPAGSELCGLSPADIQRLRTGAAICVPLMVDSASTGALLVVRGARQAYDAADVDLTLELGCRMGSVLETARMFEVAAAASAHADELLAVAAHELRTPVAVLSGYSQLLRRQIQRGVPIQTENVQTALARIDSQSRRLAVLITNLLDAERESDLELEPQASEVDLCQVARAVVEFAHVAHPDRRISVEAADPIWASVDAGRIEQVLSNLLDNACKFSPIDTPVEVWVERASASTVRLSVRDYGPGVPREQRERIFERFARGTSDRHVDGLGLGLYVSRKVVEQQRGSLRAQFPVEGGSRFVVELRCAANSHGKE